ncbi:MAG TPA: redoxin family protein [Elusimicrobiota bacterium]|nr:redoxin family protein [Elusimicrobiota bacterium]
MRALAPLAALLLFAACSRDLGAFDATLETADGAEVSLKSCPTPKCLTVYVAPWCGICRGATPFIKDLREYLSERGVASRVVVGKDRPEALKDYATAFGPDALLDPDGLLAPKGVPQFFVSDAQGKILKALPGATPAMLQRPYPRQLLARMADALGVAR